MTDQSGRLRFEAARDRGRDYFRALYNYLLHYARDAYEDFAGEEHSAFDAVSVLTIHQAKGLEWPVVFLPALVEGRFPSRLAGTPQTWLLPEDVFPPGYWPIRCSSPSPLRRRGRRCGARRGDWWCGIWPSTRTS